MDSTKRFNLVAQSLESIILRHIKGSENTIAAVQHFTQHLAETALEAFLEEKKRYFDQPDATPFLGRASAKIYSFIRRDLKIPLVKNSTITTPYPERTNGQGPWNPINDPEKSGVTMGSLSTKIYDSMRSGALYAVVMGCFQEIRDD